MNRQATTVSDYLVSLAPDRREAIETMRQFSLNNLGTEFQESMQ